MTEATQRTSDSGVSIWLDDLSRTRIESGNLQELIKDKNVVGVTTNPSIFQKALSQVGPYDAQLKELGKVDVETAIRELTTTDVRNATDIFREIAEATDFVDGRVSIEGAPRLAHETEATERTTTLEHSLESHFMALAAEESRLRGGELINMDAFKNGK